MVSPFLQIADVPANTSNPWTPTNAIRDALDRAQNGLVSKVISGSTSFSTTETRQNATIVLTGTPGAPFTVDMPDAFARKFTVINLADAEATIRNSSGGGATQPVLAALEGVADLHYDGSTFYQTGSGAGGSGAVAVQQDGVEVLAQASALNLVGSGVVVSSPVEGEARINIPGLQVASPGPMKFLGEYDLSGASLDITDFGDRGAIEVVMYIVGAAITVDGSTVVMQFNAGGVVTTGYEGGGERNSGSSVANFGGVGGMLLTQTDASQGLGNAAGENLNAQVILHAPFVANQRKDISFQSAWGRALNGLSNSGYGGAGNSSVTAALDGVRLLPGAGNFTAGKVYVFGIYAENPAVVTAGLPGPWRHVATKTAAAVASLDIEEFAGRGYKKLMLVFNNITVSVDDTELQVRSKLNGTYKSTANYARDAFRVAGNDTSDIQGTGVATAIALTSNAAAEGIGNAATESFSCTLEVYDPDGATNPKRLTWQAIYENSTSVGIHITGGGMYQGTDEAASLEGIQVLVDSGTFSGTIEVYGLLAENPVISPGGAPGPVVQHVHSRDDVTRTTASSTYVTATAAVTITPQSVDHRVRIRVTTVAANNNVNGAVYATLFRNGVTDLTPAGRDGMLNYANGQNLPINQAFEFVDNPATTSPVTYNLFFKTNGQGTASLGGRSSDTNFDGYTMMVAEEILDDGQIASSPFFLNAPHHAAAPTADEVIFSFVATQDMDFPLDLAGSAFEADVAATALTTFDVQKNGISIGSIVVAIAGTTGVPDVDPAFSLAPGDQFRVIAPTSPDATLAGIDQTYAGTTPVFA